MKSRQGERWPGEWQKEKERGSKCKGVEGASPAKGKRNVGRGARGTGRGKREGWRAGSSGAGEVG